MSHIGQKEIFTIALGSVIGWGAFMLPGNVFLPNYGVVNTLIGFIIAIAMLVFIEKSYVAVMDRVPKAGGEYSFANELLGQKSGFITGWGLLLAYVSIIPLNATAVPMVLDAVFPFYDKGTLLYSVAGYPVFANDIMVSLAIIIVFAIINLKGIKGALAAQNIFVFALLFSLIIIGLFAAFNIHTVELDNLNTNWGTIDTASIIRIIAFAPWAFIGFDAVAQLSGDHDIDANKVSKMTLLAIITGALVYNALNVITALGIGQSALVESSWATGEAVRHLVGNGIFYLLAVAMFGAVISGLNGFFISSSRLVMSMSEDYGIGVKSGTTPERTTAASTSDLGADLSATRQHPKAITEPDAKALAIPNWVMYFIALFAMTVPFFGRTALLWFVDLASVGASIAYFMTCLCAYKIAKTGASKIMSGMGMLVSMAFLVFLLTPWFDSNISIPSYYSLLFWSVLGVVVYFWANQHKAGRVA